MNEKELQQLRSEVKELKKDLAQVASILSNLTNNSILPEGYARQQTCEELNRIVYKNAQP